MKVLKSPAVLILVGAVAGIVFGLVVGSGRRTSSSSVTSSSG